ncbi:MAG: hypothetical protein FJ318_00045 [SAR202 cluster bacterium]|nr:hypothetical protein [SAR202 cluster bacterium]
MAKVYSHYTNEYIEFEKWNEHLDKITPDIAISYYVGKPTLIKKLRVPSGYYYESYTPQPPLDMMKRALQQAQSGQVRNGFFPINAELNEWIEKNNPAIRAPGK